MIAIKVVAILLVAATFQTLAWYLHLKFPSWGYWLAFVVSLLFVIPEYLMLTKGNSMGNGQVCPYISSGYLP